MDQRIRTEWTKLEASDGFALRAYVAGPEERPKAGVVVIQEIWGVNRWVRSVADRFARHGFLAVAPAMFDRIRMGFESDDYANGSAYATMAEEMKAFSHETAMLDVGAAVRRAGEGGKVGITGYCFGGATSWRAAARVEGLSAASGYYGGGVPTYIDLVPRVPTEMHFGSTDKGIPLEQVEALRARHPEVDIYLYEAGHGFCCSERASFDEAACTKASARTLAFFHRHLV